MSGGEGRAFEGDVGRPENPFEGTVTVPALTSAGDQLGGVIEAELRTRGEVTAAGDTWIRFRVYRAEEAESIADGLIDLLDNRKLNGRVDWSDQDGDHTRTTG
jgi:hypothetical protein